MIGTKLQLSPVCLECWQPTDQVRLVIFIVAMPFKEIVKEEYKRSFSTEQSNSPWSENSSLQDFPAA